METAAPQKPVMDVAPPRTSTLTPQLLPVKPAPAEDGQASPESARPAAPPKDSSSTFLPLPPPKAAQPSGSQVGIVVLTITTMIALSALAIVAYLKP